MAQSDVLTVLCTCPDERQAATLGASLVDAHLAACINIVPAIRSIFRWEGRTVDESETLMIIKTTVARLAALTEQIQSLHPYDEPEIVAIPVVGGSESYLDWVRSTSQIS